MKAMQPQSPQVMLIDEASCFVDPGNIRPQHRISADRILQLAASIKDTQQRGGGHYGTGLERPICIYENGRGEYYVPEGQERLLAIRHLRANDPEYRYLGVPAVLHDPPANIWDSTRFQMSHHNADPVDPVSLVERAVLLKQSCDSDGKPATWQMVAEIMGGAPSIWAHYQHILALTDALKQAVVAREIRPQIAAIIGRDLPEPELQTRFQRDLLTEAKSKPRLEALIQRIRRQIALEAAEEDTASETYELSDEEEGEEQASVLPPTLTEVDREAIFLINQLNRALSRLEVLGDEGRLTGMLSEIAAAIDRLQELKAYAS